MKSEYINKAVQAVSKRRINAISLAEHRKEEVIGKIPQIEGILHEMSNTGFRLASIIISKDADAKRKIEEIKCSNLKNQAILKELLEANGYPADYLDEKFTCSICSDSGYIDGHMCECLKQLAIKYNIEDFNEKNKIQSNGFTDFSLDYYSKENIVGANRSPYEIMSDIFAFCMSYAKDFKPNSDSILMIGKTGLGKTHLSLAIAQEISKNGYSALYASAPDLFRKLQEEYFGRGEQGVDTMKTLLDADLVIIDDLGAEIDNQFTMTSLYNIVNTRINYNKPVIISTNLTLKEIEQRYSERIASRLATIYKCLKFVGKDIRLIKLKNR